MMSRAVPSSLAFLAGAALLVTAAMPLRAHAAAAATRLSLYRDGLALVQEQRHTALQKGENEVAFGDLSRQLQADTVLLEPGAPGVHVVQQRFEAGGLTPERLLQAYMGRRIELVRTNPVTGKEQREPARVLSTQGGLVLQLGDRVETGVSGRLSFPGVPPTLHRGPQLQARIAAAHGGRAAIELSYLTGGLGWDADYAAELEGDRMQLHARARIRNDTGVDFQAARVRLIAGSPHRVAAPAPQLYAAQRAGASAGARTRSFEYHRYALPGTLTLPAGTTLQTSLFEQAHVRVEHGYLLEGDPAPFRIRRPEREALAVQTRLHWRSAAPVPAGVLRVYRRAADGGREFLGEARIGPAPAGAPIDVPLGQAFDLRAERVQTVYERRATVAPYEHAVLSAYAISLHNAGARAVSVTVREPIPGDWHIEQESHPHQRTSAGTAQWQLQVPAHGETVLRYRVLSRS